MQYPPLPTVNRCELVPRTQYAAAVAAAVGVVACASPMLLRQSSSSQMWTAAGPATVPAVAHPNGMPASAARWGPMVQALSHQEKPRHRPPALTGQWRPRRHPAPRPAPPSRPVQRSPFDVPPHAAAPSSHPPAAGYRWPLSGAAALSASAAVFLVRRCAGHRQPCARPHTTYTLAGGPGAPSGDPSPACAAPAWAVAAATGTPAPRPAPRAGGAGLRRPNSRAHPVLLVDGSYYMHRAFHSASTAEVGLDPDGLPQGAVYGCVRYLKDLITEYEPSHMAVVFDAPGETFRHRLYAAYKGTRPPMDPALKVQIAPLQALVRAMGIPSFCVAGVEGDDVIGTLSRMTGGKGLHTLVCSGAPPPPCAGP